MAYKIKSRQRSQAKKLGVTIKPSKSKNKKIDVFKKGKKIATIGDSRYQDYATYRNNRGVKYADSRKRLYKARHQRTRLKKGSNSYYADKILWSWIKMNKRKKYLNRQFRLTKRATNTALKNLRKRKPNQKHISSKVSGGYYIYSYKKKKSTKNKWDD